MIEIIKEREYQEVTEYSRSFVWRDDPNSGFGFPCDETGNVDTAALQPAGLENYNRCISGDLDVIDQGVLTYHHHWYESAVGRCSCGRAVELSDSFVNTCYCGRDYSGNGQLLAPRSQWGEETGESLADIFSSFDPEEIRSLGGEFHEE